MKRPTALAWILVLAPLVVLTAACSGSSSGDMFGDSNKGAVRVVLTADSAASTTLAATTKDHGGGDRPRIVGAEIAVNDIVARSATQQQLVDVGMDLPITVDLFALSESSGQFELGMGSLPPDTYDQIIVVISSLTLTARDGTRITIEPPGGGWTAQVRTEPFDVVEGEVTTIQIRFRMRSFHFDLDDALDSIGSDDFDPEIDCEVDDHD